MYFLQNNPAHAIPKETWEGEYKGGKPIVIKATIQEAVFSLGLVTVMVILQSLQMKFIVLSVVQTNPDES